MRIFATLTALLVAAGANAAILHTDAASFDAATSDPVVTALPHSGYVGNSAVVDDLTFTTLSGALYFGYVREWSTVLDGPELAVDGRAKRRP